MVIVIFVMRVQHGVDSPLGYEMVTNAINLLRGQMSDSEQLYKKHMREWHLLQRAWKLKADLKMISDNRSCEKLENALHQIALIKSLLRRQHLELLGFYHHAIQKWIIFKITLLPKVGEVVCASHSMDSLDSVERLS